VHKIEGNKLITTTKTKNTITLKKKKKTMWTRTTGKIMIMDILIAVDGITMKQGVDNIPWVREHILGDPGTAVELDLLRGDGAQFSSRYHVSLVRAGAQPSCQKSNEEFLGMQIKNLLARIQEQLGRIQELETNKDSLKSLLAQREKDLLETETRHAVRDSEARNALNDAQSLKQELAAAKNAAAIILTSEGLSAIYRFAHIE
jgi:hypothetical protein